MARSAVRCILLGGSHATAGEPGLMIHQDLAETNAGIRREAVLPEQRDWLVSSCSVERDGGDPRWLIEGLIIPVRGLLRLGDQLGNPRIERAKMSQGAIVELCVISESCQSDGRYCERNVVLESRVVRY